MSHFSFCDMTGTAHIHKIQVSSTVLWVFPATWRMCVPCSWRLLTSHLPEDLHLLRHWKKSISPHCLAGQRTLFMYLTAFTEFLLNVLLTEEEPYDRRGTPTSVKRKQQTVKHELLWALDYLWGTTQRLEMGIRSLGRKTRQTRLGPCWPPLLKDNICLDSRIGVDFCVVEGLDYYNGLADLNCLYNLQNTNYIWKRFFFKIGKGYDCKTFLVKRERLKYWGFFFLMDLDREA